MDRLTTEASIRPMRAEDVGTVVAIEHEAFSTPWQAETFRGLIGRDGVELMVMEDREHGIVGYAVLWVVLDQAELANIAIIPEVRGRGLGARLLEAAIDMARGRGVRAVYLEVRESNETAIHLYRRFGFEEIGRRRGYYTRPREDALVMERQIG